MTKTNTLKKEEERFEYKGLMLTAEEYKAAKQGHMVVMESLQTRTISNTSGHAVRFEAKTPRLVPRSLVKDAMAVGCVPVEASDATFVEGLQRTKHDFGPGLRKVIILMAMNEIYTKNDADQFSGSGQPRQEVLNDLVGFDVSKKEQQSLWQELNSIKKADGDLPTHPNADTVYKIINAEDRAELILLAEEMGIEKDKVEGLVNKDLRFMLLKTYSN